MSIDASDAALKEKIRGEKLESMRPEHRMAQARAGTLDQFLDDHVATVLQTRAGI